MTKNDFDEVLSKFPVSSSRFVSHAAEWQKKWAKPEIEKKSNAVQPNEDMTTLPKSEHPNGKENGTSAAWCGPVSTLYEEDPSANENGAGTSHVTSLRPASRANLEAEDSSASGLVSTEL